MVWSEDFNTGSLPGDWTVLEGSFTCTNNRLESQTGIWHSAYRASTVAEGEWRFDVHYDQIASMTVAFIAEDTTGPGQEKPQNGYLIQISRFDQAIRLVRHVGGVQSYMGYHPMTGSNDYSIIVTRDSSGEFNVWIDGTLRITATNTAVTTSAYFLVVIVDPGSWIDNIAVYDEIITIPPDDTNGTPTTTPTIPGFPVIAIAVGIITALTIGVLYRRRQLALSPSE